jgi:hypothetical protein
MVQQLQVFGWTDDQPYLIDPGDSQGWIAWGEVAEYGRLVTIAAQALAREPSDGGEAVLEVVSLQHEVGADNNRRIFFTVRNTGSRDAYYRISYAYTDVVN